MKEKGFNKGLFAGNMQQVGRIVLVLFSLMLIAHEADAQEAGAPSIMSPALAPNSTAMAPAAGADSGNGMASQANSPAAQSALKGALDDAQLRALEAAAAKNKSAQTKTGPGDEEKKKAEQDESRLMPETAHNQFQIFVAQSIGKELPIYGHDLFNRAPSTFAPVDNIPVTSDYVIGPGDEVVIHTWGPQLDLNFQLEVDRNGGIDIPRVGRVDLAGIRYSELHGHLKKAIGKSFRNFELSAMLGKLRSIDVFVLGQARRPGVYTVSSLSTLVNTLFASGGPSVSGSMRHIQVKRGDKVISELDMYDLLLKGDKSKDVRLLPGDVIYIPTVGKLAAISGSVNNEAIFELKDEKSTLSGLIELAGGLTTVASGQKVRVERIDDRKVRKVDEFALDSVGLDRRIQDGDLIQVSPISPRFDNAVTLRGNVASPGRYPWHKGMRVKDLIPEMNSLIVPGYWDKQNQIYRSATNEQGLHGEVIGHNRAEINWDYAVIERLKMSDLSTVLFPFNLGKAIENKDAPDNLPLEQGDVITIFSRDDIRVPVARQSTYIRLEGEVTTPGVYKALPGETLRQLVDRVGGLSANAYLFGAELDRVSVRESQQQRLIEMADRIQADIERDLAAKQHGALSAEDMNAAQMQAAAQLDLVKKMRNVQATGRVVLELPSQNSGVKDLPDLALEDGDRFYVPSKPAVVSVMGMVYNQNVFVYRPGAEVSDYLAKAGGPTRDADESRIYLLRADGSVISSQNYGSFFNSFSGKELAPGDTLVVPELLDKFALTKALKDWSQIFFQFALGAAGVKVLGLF